MARVSVIVPVFNAERYIEQCISSIARQTLDDIEIIAVNDGSTDRSLDILDRLSSKFRSNLRVYSKENGGAGSARNFGIENVRGEFIKFVDADDYLALDILERMYTIAKEQGVSLVRGNYRTIMGPIKMEDKCSWSDITGSQVVDVREHKDYIVTETPGIGNKLISRELIGNLRFPERTKWEDLAIMPVIIASSERVFHMDEPVYNYRVSMNTTIKDFISKIPNILDIIKCVENIEKEMTARNLYEEYKKQIESLYILHTLFRVENAMLWANFPHKDKEIVVSSLLAFLDSKYPNWQENEIVEQYKTKNGLFAFDMRRLDRFVNSEYRNVDQNTALENTARAFR